MDQRDHNGAVPELASIVAASGVPFPVRVWRPAAEARGAVVAVHGLATHARWFDPLGRALAEQGIALYAADRCGSGDRADSPGASAPETWMDEIGRVAKLARERHGEVIGLLWCWGAVPGTVAAAQGCFSRLIYVAPGLMPSAAMAGRMRAPGYRLRVLLSLLGLAGGVPLPYDPERDFSENPGVRALVREDALLWRRIPGRFLLPALRLGKEAVRQAGRLKVPALCILAGGDVLVDNAATRALLDRQTVRELPGGHAILLEQPGALADAVAGWIGAR